MARRKFGFRPTLRNQVAAVSRVLDFYDRRGDPNYGPEVEKANELAKLDESGDKLVAGFAPTRGPKRNFTPPDQLEGAILSEIAAMLAEHPRVAIAIRQNSGSASYEAKSGRYAPVHFYSFIKRPEKMRIPDIWGLLTDGRYYAIEAKRANWKGPTDAREREQAAFIETVRALGGIAGFARSANEAAALITPR